MVTLLGRGAKLIGGSIKTTLQLKDVQTAVLEGFFPIVARDELSKRDKRVGITQIGFPMRQMQELHPSLRHFYKEDLCQQKFFSMVGQ